MATPRKKRKPKPGKAQWNADLKKTKATKRTRKRK